MGLQEYRLLKGGVDEEAPGAALRVESSNHLSISEKETWQQTANLGVKQGGSKK